MSGDPRATTFVSEARAFIGAERASRSAGTVPADLLQASAGGSMGDGLRLPATAPPIGGSFDEVVLPHRHAALRLARWLMRNEHDAEDVVQEASLRAFRYFRTFTGGNGRAWFLRIVRNTCRGFRGRGLRVSVDEFDEKQHSGAQPPSDPETLLLRTDDLESVERAMGRLTDHYREILALRELQGLSYQELAAVMGIPMGTVMSSLSRAREAFRRALDHERKPSRPQGVRRPSSPGRRSLAGSRGQSSSVTTGSPISLSSRTR
jgi:RNA polymerase sigma-70 factor (ECF subfamily)